MRWKDRDLLTLSAQGLRQVRGALIAIADRVISHLVSSHAAPEPAFPKAQRERQVLVLMAEGRDNASSPATST